VSDEPTPTSAQPAADVPEADPGGPSDADRRRASAIGAGLAIGAGVGAALSAATGSSAWLAAGIGVGIALGAGIGAGAARKR
jgi:hypothetical protein